MNDSSINLLDEGCLSAETRVLMADGSQKEIAHICLGDMVQNIAGGYSRVINVMTGMESECLKMALENGRELCGTKAHPVMTDSGFKPLEAIRVGERVQIEEGGFQTVTGIVFENCYGKVYNLELDGDDHGFGGNGIATGDFCIEMTVGWRGRGL